MPTKPLTQEELDAQNLALGRTQFNTEPAKVGTSITSESLAPTTPIQVPPPTLPTPLSNSGTDAVLAANQKAFEKAQTDQAANKTNADLYTSTYGVTPEQARADKATAQTAYNTSLQEYQTSQDTYNALNAQIQGLDYQQNTVIPNQVIAEYEGRASVAGQAGITEQRQRQILLQKAPLQYQALLAQADMANKLGKGKLAEGILNQANAHIDSLFEAKKTDLKNTVDRQNSIIDKAWSYFTEKEKTKAADIKEQTASNNTQANNYINDVQTAIKAATDSGNFVLAGSIAKLMTATLDPTSKTFATDYAKANTDLARLQGQIRPKPTSESAPTSYKEWELAGKPGTYADWLKEQNVKAPTIAQQTVAEYAARLEQANPIIEKLTPAINGMNVLSFEAQLRAIPRLQSAEIQQYKQAASNFINAKLRRESGAVISPSEFTEARAQYLPVPGDKPETLAQKKANRDLVYASLRKAAGNAYESVEDLMKGADTTSTEASPKTIEYPLGSGKHYSVDAQGNMTPI